MVAKYILLLLSLHILFLEYLNAQELKSPCPHIFVYQQRDDSTDRWYGLINLESEVDVTGVTLKLTLENPALQLGNLLGRVITYNYKEYIITNNNFKLTSSSSHLLRFYVSYDPKKPIPNLVSIEQNNKTICPTPPAPFSQDFISEFVGVVVDPQKQDNNYEIQCGTIAAQATPLIINGQTADVGKYPWHAAIYRPLNNEELRYICGGSLIAKQYVLTAAHCLLYSTRDGKIVEASAFKIDLGKNDLGKGNPKAQTSEVSDVIVHPEYNTKNYNNNIGLLKLKKPVIYNDFVRPVCLWEGDTDYEKIVNKNGTFVGMGTDETDWRTGILKVAELSFGSTQDCLKSNPDFYITRNTYCAGFINGSGPCTGDSGGGMVFLNETSGRKVYYLRGIASYGQVKCDKANYVVFIDVATYLDFIKANLQ